MPSDFEYRLIIDVVGLKWTRDELFEYLNGWDCRYVDVNSLDLCKDGFTIQIGLCIYETLQETFDMFLMDLKDDNKDVKLSIDFYKMKRVKQIRSD